MTLPKLSSNFEAVEIKTPDELKKEQADLEEAQRKVEEFLATQQSYSQQLENINSNSSVGAKLKYEIIKNTVDPLLTALLNVGCTSFELPILQLSLLTNLYLLGIKIPAIPTGIPIDLPALAEFIQYINAKIEESKKQCQQQAIAKQLVDAQDEETPFTARQNTRNRASQTAGSGEFQRLAPLQTCITTETGATEEEAIQKAEFKLKRVLRCCECCGNTGLQILSSKQENGIFIVTAGILES